VPAGGSRVPNDQEETRTTGCRSHPARPGSTSLAPGPVSPSRAEEADIKKDETGRPAIYIYKHIDLHICIYVYIYMGPGAGFTFPCGSG